MSSALVILEHLLDDESIESKEHVIETISPRIANVQTRISDNFDELVQEISTKWGAAQYNNTIGSDSDKEPAEPPAADGADGEGQETTSKRKAVKRQVPPWSHGVATKGVDAKALRLSYWKRPNCLGYVVLRTELDDKKQPVNYALILGARRRTPDTGRSVDKLRQAQSIPWYTQIFGWLTKR